MSQPRKPAPARKTKPGLPRRLALLALAAAVIAAGAWAWLQRGDEGGEGAWRTTVVERGDIRVVISATGTLSATSTVVIGSQISGQVTDVLVDFNDQVRKGQLIARIDPSSYQAQIDQGNAQVASARAALAQAEATLRNAELDHRRKAGLGERQLVARSDVDLARSALDQARAQVASARAQIRQQAASLQTTQVNLDRTEIRSPVDGVVLTRTIEPGQTVAASLQAPELFTIAEDLGKMQIELAVDEADIGQVAEGQAVTFTVDAFADRRFRGEVRQVRLSATDTNNVITYPVVVSVDNGDGTLLPGLTVNAEIEVSHRDDVLLASNAALRYKPSDAQAAALQAPPVRAGGGAVEGLARLAGTMELTAAQREAFDAAIAQIRQRAEARRAAAPQGGGSVFGGGGGGMRVIGPGAGDGNIQAQMRQRMLQRYRQDFAAFRDSLDAGQRQRWDRELVALAGARYAPVYKLVDDRPRAAMVRIGASDGSNTEISGEVAEGDILITGERADP
ncbi:efflux RND transporter periplasmic adaptor subunit [Luteimonas sp. RD2P54]|uniref:Efflux RND transporter periplasmic adaptor subunit n=1 Tax=Luteimonas endophytica TaxID=3042023 RepID=A0ABT6J5T5_9GAMM|nr:efflux RND transporter periplasmic adaptor subunit [Luteimonas endophytica]MDH5822191.1 efflux RND transporter periplasmic adaptor subunit [Luteimonas endophytica]